MSRQHQDPLAQRTNAGITSCRSGSLNQFTRSACLALFMVWATPTLAAVPFAGEMAVQVVNYNRASSWLATGGAFPANQMAELKAAGFINIVDLRRPQEGTEVARAAAEAAGLHYVNLPLGRDKPDAETQAKFDAWVAQHQGENTLLHCASGNRAGTLWALHLLGQQVPVEQAVEQGLAAGMAQNRVGWIRETASPGRQAKCSDPQQSGKGDCAQK